MLQRHSASHDLLRSCVCVCVRSPDADTGALDGNEGGYAACAVCQPTDGAIEVYTQWGRTNCSSGHRTEYSGLVMAQRYSGHGTYQRTTENVCVDLERARQADMPTGHLPDGLGSRLYTTEMEGGSSDESLYPPNREVACAVCSVPATTS